MTVTQVAADFTYDVDAEWESLPAGIQHKDVSAVGVDSRDQVYLLTRYDSNVLVYDRDGSFITAWGREVFTNPHGLTVGPDDSVYCVDNGDHSVRKFSADGKLLMTLGRPGEPSDTGHKRNVPFVVHNVETVERPGPPFNGCTNLAIAADGRVLVCERENDRIQVFDAGGRFLTEWTDVQRPCKVAVDGDGFAYVAELWRPKGKGSFTGGFMKEDRPGRVTIFDRDGSIVARWGASTINRAAPGCFIAPHGIAVDSHGDVYVSEVTYTFGIRANGLGDDHASHQIQKFTRRS